MTIVSPSILSADFTKLGADCRMVLDAGAQMLHYDERYCSREYGDLFYIDCCKYKDSDF